MSRRFTFFACFTVLVGVLVASCNTDGEQKRAVVAVSSMNGNAPYFSDVLEQGDTLIFPAGTPQAGQPFLQDDFVGEDYVPVLFKNRPYNAITFTGPDRPYSDFLITRYRVDWRRTDGGAGVPPTYEGATSINVPTGEEVFGSIVLVPFEVKNSALMTTINYLGATFPDEYLMIADVTFFGHEVGSGREQEFGASVSVNFADPVVVTERD